MKSDLYQRVTDRIVCQLEEGVRPWVQPWSAGRDGGRVIRPLRFNGQPYNGINILMQRSAADEKGYASPTWMTFKQAHEFGAHVRKGEQGSLVVYADRIIRAETDENTGEESARQIPFLKGYTVFNVEQIEGLPAHFHAKPEAKSEPVARINHAKAFFAATGATVVHGGSRACYVPRTDNIHMPCIDCFRGAESYYATLAHEATHGTQQPSRLDRDFVRKRWGDEGYAMEELVAELGAAFLSADLELTRELREDHAP
jgi:antirestriction protein ArdC